jgi:hypothetical protein
MPRKPMPCPLNLALAIARIYNEPDRVELVTALRKDGFTRPGYTCKPGEADRAIALVRCTWDISFNLNPNAGA